MEAVESFTTYADLADAAREFYRRGWVLGTSGNFSAIASRDPIRISITASGLQKQDLDETSFLEIDGDANILSGTGKPSAETKLHLSIYRERPSAGSVLHTHSVWGTILADERNAIQIDGYEMLKGLAGVTTHEYTESVPVVENSQDYVQLSFEVERLLRQQTEIHGFYLRRHGLYTWGETIAEARRHVEIFEFLFEVLGRMGRKRER